MYTWKYQKTYGIMMFSGGIEMESVGLELFDSHMQVPEI